VNSLFSSIIYLFLQPTTLFLVYLYFSIINVFLQSLQISIKQNGHRKERKTVEKGGYFFQCRLYTVSVHHAFQSCSQSNSIPNFKIPIKFLFECFFLPHPKKINIKITYQFYFLQFKVKSSKLRKFWKDRFLVGSPWTFPEVYFPRFS